jgi:hypothetical protein
MLLKIDSLDSKDIRIFLYVIHIFAVCVCVQVNTLWSIKSILLVLLFISSCIMTFIQNQAISSCSLIYKDNAWQIRTQLNVVDSEIKILPSSLVSSRVVILNFKDCSLLAKSTFLSYILKPNKTLFFFKTEANAKSYKKLKILLLNK